MNLIENTIDFLADYFGKNLKPRIRIYYIKKFEGYDERNFKRAIDNAIENGTFERFPKLPELKMQINKYCKSDGQVRYNRESDPSFPVGLMWDAFNILVDKGEKAFINYCETVKMPLDDRVRVTSKKESAYNIKQLTNNMLN